MSLDIEPLPDENLVSRYFSLASRSLFEACLAFRTLRSSRACLAASSRFGEGFCVTFRGGTRDETFDISLRPTCQMQRLEGD